MKRKFCILFLLILLTFLYGCEFNKTDDSETNKINEFTPTVLPTYTPSPSPTLTPTPSPITRMQYGELAFFNGEYDQAEIEFTNIVNTADSPDLIAEAKVFLSQIKMKENDCNAVIPILQLILDEQEIKPEIKAKASFLLAECYNSLNQYSNAAENYLKYVEIYPGVLDRFMLEKAGDAYLSAGDIENALNQFNLAIIAGNDEVLDSVKIKIGQIYNSQSEYTNAIRMYMEVHDQSPNEYTRAQMNFLSGQAYLLLGLPEQAYARFQESVQNYPKAFDTYSGLVVLVNEGIPVDEFNRGLVDYYAGRYGLAVDAFNRYLNSNPDHNGSAHYYKAFAFRAMDQIDNAIQEWRILIQDHPDDRFYVDAWEDIAYTQWAFQNDYLGGASTLLTFVSTNPSNEGAPQALYDAGRIYERSGYLTEASATWSRLIEEYPQTEISSQALYLSGIIQYRLENYQTALEKFQRVLLLGGTPTISAASQLWLGKTYSKLGKMVEAENAWKSASTADPTGYYSIRALELISDQAPYATRSEIKLETNLEQERIIAEIWMQSTFSLPPETNFSSIDILLENKNFKQAIALWNLGLYEYARNKFELVREANNQDALNLFRLTNYFFDIGLYRSALLSSRQILALANMDDYQTLNAPLWFNHIRFGNYYYKLVSENAEKYNFDPILILSLIRQESFYEGFISSSAGAIGVMQIMPATGEEISQNIKWPENYTQNDLLIPSVNIRFGVSYLARMRELFNNDLFAALAAYNAGPGNVLNWENQANNDPDLLLEIIPFEETRRYITNIYEFYHLYEHFYPAN